MRKWFNYIPTYEELKHLDKNYEYVYKICDFIGSGYLRLTYNEEYLGKISIDYLEDGYLHNVSLPIRDKTKIIENKFYNLNKKNYVQIIKFIELVKESCINQINGGFKYEKML